MLLVTPLEDQVRGRRIMRAGEPVVAYDINAGEMLLAGECRVEPIQPQPIGPWKAGMRALLTRPGGFGDLLFLTPAIAALAAQDVEVHVCCSPTVAEVLRHHPDVAGIHDYPLPLAEVTGFDQCVWLEGVLERPGPGRTLHAVDAMAAAAGVVLTDKRCRLCLPPEAELAPLLVRFPRQADVPRVGIQVRASQACRSYPAALLEEVIRLLVDGGAEVWLFGAPGTVRCPTAERVLNLTQIQPAPTFLESCALLRTCDALVAPDSGLCHAAGALDVPTVALYGPFPWQLRTAYQPAIRALTGHCSISPCFHQERGGMTFPPHGPCARTGRCEALAGIAPRRIVAKVLSAILGGGPGRRKAVG